MKKQLLVSGLVTLGCLWYLLVGVSSVWLPTTQSDFEEQVAYSSGKIVGERGLLDLHTTPWEQTTNGANRTISSLVKVAFPLNAHALNADDLKIVSIFRAYSGYYRLLLIRHRKLDSLFPYHYFW